MGYAKQFFRHKLGVAALIVLILFCIVGVYAPFFASSKPFVVIYNDTLYFPFFRYLFYSGFYTKRIDIFFNLMMFTLPLMLLVKRVFIPLVIILQLSLFAYYGYFHMKDPASTAELGQERFQYLKNHGGRLTWNEELSFLNDYGKLNLVLNYRNRLENHQRLLSYDSGENIPTLWQMEQNNELRQIAEQKQIIEECDKDPVSCQRAKALISFREERRLWLEEQRITFILMPLFRSYHWEEDAGGDQSLNKVVPWYELTRINRKDLMAALIFGIRISLVVGLLSVALALLIGIPIGVFAGYYGGKFDMIVSRLLEIWESMPTFFMLLFIVAITQSKSIFLVIAIVGIFGWTSFSRFIRGEFFKQRNLPYVEACHALGFRDGHIMFTHILPNAAAPVITLLPFAIMGAISSEAGLSFLGLGEEGSCSWGVLMDEGRAAFPAESYLLWPPAILLTTLLVSIALVGDALRDTIDPKLS